jgi:hypothetical protein
MVFPPTLPIEKISILEEEIGAAPDTGSRASCRVWTSLSFTMVAEMQTGAIRGLRNEANLNGK